MEMGYYCEACTINGQNLYFLCIAHPLKSAVLCYGNAADALTAMCRATKELPGLSANKAVRVPLNIVQHYLEAAYNQAGVLFSKIDNHQVYISPV